MQYRKLFFLEDRLTEAQIEKFKLFEDEEMIFACREHWLIITIRLIRYSVVGVFLAAIISFASIFFLREYAVTLGIFFLIILMIGTYGIRDLIHWSFHLYIATNRQIIEVQYTPILSENINSILLDQIRCTEIDVSMNGIIPELLGIGDVELTFDRPTHKEMFVMRSIRSPRYIANLLSSQIHQGVLRAKDFQNNVVTKPFWVKELKKNKYQFLGNVSYGYFSK